MSFKTWISAFGVALGVILPFQAVALSPASTPRVSRAVRHDTSPALRDIPVKRVQPAESREIEIRLPARIAAKPKPAGREDPLRQRNLGPAAAPAASLIFDGQSDDENAAVLGFRIVPPDTNGDVGKSHYVQFINLILSVYDKKSGARIFGPVAGNSIWSGFGGECETHNDGDPVVLYDAQADRWIVSQFAIAADGHQCVAVSSSGDPAGAYHRYDFVVSPNALNDYPKLGVWPDGYYMSANQYGSSGFDGVIVVAFERSKMLAGQAAQMVEFGPLPCAEECPFTLQPSHLNGPPPDDGTPNTYVMPWDDQYFGTGTKPDGYRLWNFHVDWTTPSSSTFTALPQLDTAPFDANLCNAMVHCIPQPPPGERVDALGPWSMYRAQYRSFRDHASVVVNHSVDVDGHNLAGIRWVELRDAGGGWSIFQAGAYAPADGDHRWLGSIAMDQAGDIALGFSVSGTNTMPSIRYVTRKPDDPPGTFSSAETDLVLGGGVQQASFGRWGDYSTMSVDPRDGCTFWYTQEYYANTGTFDFKTSIGSFKVPDCR